MHRKSMRWLAFLVALSASSTSCILQTAEASLGRSGGLAASSSAPEGPPIYDCWSRALLPGSVCVPRETAPPRRAPVLAAARPQATYQRPRGGVLWTRTNIRGGQLLLRGQPATHPTRALLSFRSTSALAPAPCSVRLFRDGTELTVHESARASDHEALVTVDIVDLRQLQHSVRFAGEVCGRSFELDELARATLSQFEARFSEERGKLERAESL